jgi:TonB-linked SusC/RagA family outer membrane protein
MKTKLSGIMTLFLAFVVQISFAQERTITGTVSDESGALPGVSVLIEGTTSGTETDFDGNYSIEANSGDVLRYSFVGMTTVTKTVGAESSINATMVSEENTLDEVVVTALGIKREKKSLGYATQQVDGDAINTVKDPNFVNSLQGKASGVDVKASGTLGGSTNVVIRGYSSMFNSNQALFVVDGVPVSNVNNNTADQSTGRGGYDYGNAAQDINPDDIESVNVLKGGGATALYGSRAANGVILITTKKGKDHGNKAIGVTINSSVTMNTFNPDTFNRYQTEYGAGYSDYYYDAGGPRDGGFFERDLDGDGILELTTPSTEDASFGAAFDENLLIYQWDSWYPELDTYLQPTPWVAAENDPSSMFQTGVTMFNSVDLNGANEKGEFRLGYTNFNQTGILPNSEIKRNTISFNGSFNMTDKFTAGVSANYSNTDGNGRYGTGYDGRNILQSMRQWNQNNVDFDDQKDAYFATKKNITWNANDPLTNRTPIYTDNPYWTLYENYQTDGRDRIYGNVHLNYEINDWLSIYGRATIDNYNGIQEERIAVGSNDVANYTRFNERFMENNYDLMLNFNKAWDDITLTGVVGLNINRINYSSIRSSTNGGLAVPGLYSLNNSASTLLAPTEYEYARGTDGYYANASLGWRNLLYLEGSYRKDISSTLPQENNKYDYYSGSLSFLWSSLLNSNAISLGKFRIGYAKTGNAARPLSLNNTYTLGNITGSQNTASLPSTNNNANLRAETSTELELGLEMAMFKNRLGLDVSVYDKTSEDLITPVTISAASGYTAQWLNAGEIQNKGLEATIWGIPVKNQDWEWRIDLNFSKNESEVLSLPSGLDNLLLTGLQGGVSINATVGEPYGMIQGTDYVYLDGQRVVNSAGAYQSTASSTENLGTYQANFRGGLNNRITWKNLSFSFLIDMQDGGSVFSLDNSYGYSTGVTANTAGLNELGNPKRNEIADGGGVLLDGVQADGSPNTVRGRYDYYGNVDGYYGGGPNAQFVYDASFVKLREMTLSYKLNSETFRGKIQAMTFTAIGRNLHIFSKNTPYSDPEGGLSSGNVQGYQSGVYPTTRDIGFSVKIDF